MARSSDSTSAPKPKKRRWYHQVWDVFKMTRKTDPAIVWWLLLVFLGVVALGVGLGAILAPDRLWYWVVLAIPFGVLAATIVFSRRAERAAYSRIEGETGATSAVLGTIKRKWNVEEEPIAVDPRTQAMVFRAVGRPGVVLIADGGSRGVQQRLLAQERKRVNRLVPEVPIILMQVGREENQIPLPRLARAMGKQRNQITKAEVTEVSRRLRALGGVKMPIPKGVDPMRARPDRKGMRGR